MRPERHTRDVQHVLVETVTLADPVGAGGPVGPGVIITASALPARQSSSTLPAALSAAR
jgi:hypothetical protein